MTFGEKKVIPVGRTEIMGADVEEAVVKVNEKVGAGERCPGETPAVSGQTDDVFADAERHIFKFGYFFLVHNSLIEFGYLSD